MSASGLDIAAGLSSTVSDGPLLVAAAVAMLAGVVGFLSPCVLPLVPGYLAYVAGLNGVDERPSTRRSVAGAVLFVLGFTAVFVSFGVAFGELGADITSHLGTLERVFGVITIVFGLAFLGWIPLLQREAKIHALPKAGLLGAPVLGFTFGLAWTPCATPTLTAVLAVSQEQASAGRGAFLTGVYCLGLGVPFVIVAFGTSWVSGVLSFLRRHVGVVSRVGGGLLVLFGVLLVTGAWAHWMAELKFWVGPDTGVAI